ncbi:putative transcription factor C2H2 family [Helianthus annuus]|uniref:Putative dnaJ domain-containing protein n=11 Tax=Helianthus TaxID=4231 RepID=A0A251RW71_HELAN|nr:DNAJ protein JJJ1 homolog [Helianthus annuus]KAF5758411.1 putative transcription factor C2H2 family [Helianthus annuus]KAJ0436756.1 putative transcription factor C2H2 family [Helianthus annuus]KAJ0459054.1 putative transcription factor C2H2 family [Helianthus annuus]KAJ0639607.1 putative transcription factor C2H2 family [Helianthus annuus]KAJ0819671.1 putative transcription factor C2H2 family [Helianthus annuus]
MASPEKRCLYEVLNLPRDCTADEIRSAYRKLALQRHPDKLIKSGIPESEATASFQELVNAYEVLSDARERAWYDSHRSQILFSGTTSSSSAVVPDLFTFFSNSVYSGFSDKGKGFYKVYGDVFDKIYMNELNYAKRLGLGNVVKEAPVMGNLESVYEQVNAFYGYWLGFVTVMDFVWADEYDVMSGPNRKSRRLMEEENKKIRKRARREYIETVRGLAEFVKKRDKRVIDMQMKRSVEMEKKREEERVKKAEMARLKAERARAYEEPEWAKVEDDVAEDVAEEEEEGVRKNELYCVACGKKFKSDKQWKNHEQSKKHKDKVAELREAFGEEDQDNEDDDEDADDNNDNGGGDADGFVSADEVEKLKEQFEGVEIQTEEKGDEQESQSEEEFVDVNNGGKGMDDDDDDDKEKEEEDDDDEKEDDDDENSVLKAMLNNRKNIGSMRKPKKVYVEVEAEEEVDLMEYNNVKGRRKRRGRKETAKRDEYEEEQERIDKPEISSKAEVDEKREDGLHTEEPSCADNENNGGGDDGPAGKSKVSKQAPAVKVTSKKEAKSKAKNLPKGKKQKATSRNSGNECDTCGADFDSRTKLHKHLNDTGHATIKSR